MLIVKLIRTQHSEWWLQAKWLVWLERNQGLLPVLTGSWAHPPFYSVSTDDSFLGVGGRRKAARSDHSLWFNAEVKNMWRFTFIYFHGKAQDWSFHLVFVKAMKLSVPELLHAYTYDHWNPTELCSHYVLQLLFGWFVNFTENQIILTSSNFTHSSFGNMIFCSDNCMARIIRKLRSSIRCAGNRLRASFTSGLSSS